VYITECFVNALNQTTVYLWYNLIA